MHWPRAVLGFGQEIGGWRQGSELPLERMSARGHRSITQAQQLLGMGTSRLSDVIGDGDRGFPRGCLVRRGSYSLQLPLQPKHAPQVKGKLFHLPKSGSLWGGIASPKPTLKDRSSDQTAMGLWRSRNLKLKQFPLELGM